MSTGGGAAVGLVRLSLAQALMTVATAAMATICDYAAFIFTGSAFLTGLLDSGYILAFAAASFWLTTRVRPVSPRTSIVLTGLASAAVMLVLAVTFPSARYPWLLLAVLIGLFAGGNYPAWYSLLRRGRRDDLLRGRLGIYESVRSVAVLTGALSGGLLAHLLGLEGSALVVGALYVLAGLVALTFPRSDRDEPTDRVRNARAAPGVYRRIRFPLGGLATTQLMLAPILAVIPVFAVEGVDGGVRHVGLLFALFGAGSICQLFTMKARQRGVMPQILVALCLALVVGSALCALIWDSMISAGALMVSFGFGVASIGTLVNARIQTSVPEEVRDRYVARFALFHTVPLAVGSGLWGLLADFVPVPVIAVSSSVLVTAMFAIRLLVTKNRSWSQDIAEPSPNPGAG